MSLCFACSKSLERRGRLLSGTESDVPVELLRDFACLRFTGQRTLLHAAVGRKDLPLARAVLRSQGLGGLWCRDAEGQSALHHAAQPAAHGNASGTVQWLLPQMRQHAKEMLQARDHRGRRRTRCGSQTSLGTRKLHEI